MEFLVFELDQHRYALPSSEVREVLPAMTIAPFPKAPTIVEGVVNVRGAVIPVLNIRKRFGIPEKEIVPSDHLILARAGERDVVLRVDHATKLAQVAPEDVEDAAQIAPQGKYIAGVARMPEGLVLIHDLQTFFSESEADALVEAVSASNHAGMKRRA